MKIQFRTARTGYHVCNGFFLGCVVFGIVYLNADLQSLLGEAGKSILHSRGLNVTNISPLFFCDLPYEDCLCSVLSNKSDNSEKCISYHQLAGSRILPLISFFLQIFLVRELFSFSTYCPRFISSALWTTSLLSFIGIAISIYLNNCYQAYIVATLLKTGAVLCFLSYYILTVNLEGGHSSPHSNKIVPVDIDQKDMIMCV
jgi:hypothetical protein